MLQHASLQIFGFFGTLIVGVAPHLVPRFTGRPVVRPPLTRWLAAALGIAVLARLVGTWAEAGGVVLAGALLQALSFFAFASWMWRSLDPPPLGLLRRQLTLSSGWLGVACLLEVMLLSRGGEESRIFRLAAVSGVASAVGAAVGVVSARIGQPVLLLTDAVRHLFTIGFLTAVVIAMTFRLVPVLERAALPWRAARRLAFWTLTAAVVLRSSQVLIGQGWPGISNRLLLSGALVWIAQACAAASLVGAVARRTCPRRSSLRRAW